MNTTTAPITPPTKESLDELIALTGLQQIHAGAFISEDQAKVLRRMLISLPDLIPEATKRLSGKANRIALPEDRIMVQPLSDYARPCIIDSILWGVGKDKDVMLYLKGYTHSVTMCGGLWYHIPPMKIPAPYDIVEVRIPDGIKGKWVRRTVDNSGRTAFQVEAGDTTYLLSDHGETWRHYDPDRPLPASE